mmetsp:Transcript_38476/g.121219  ORF Transcript_38476/g.121219 Transcript_38476/m.121219 type:complete len:150 (+) Transcript_38476:389-838(+)
MRGGGNLSGDVGCGGRRAGGAHPVPRRGRQPARRAVDGRLRGAGQRSVGGASVALLPRGRSPSGEQTRKLLGTPPPPLPPGASLQVPTWTIHVSSLLEWLVAMGLVWRLGTASGNLKWRGLTWGLPFPTRLPAGGTSLANLGRRFDEQA